MSEIKVAVFKPFSRLSPDIFAFLINILDDDDVLQSCVAVNQRFLLLCHERYVIKRIVKYHQIGEFLHAKCIDMSDFGQIIYSQYTTDITLKALKIISKCKQRLIINASHEYLHKVDFKKLTVDTYGNNSKTFPINATSLCVSSVFPCNFPKVESLNLRVTPPYHDTTNVNLEKYQFNPEIKKLLLNCDESNTGSHKYIYYDPTNNLQNVFDYDFFMKSHPMLTECLLFFITRTQFVITVPENMVRFGISPSPNKICHTVDMSKAFSLKEFIIMDNSDNTDSTSIRLIPTPKTLQKFTIRHLFYMKMIGFEEFKHIDEMSVGLGENQYSRDATLRFKDIMQILSTCNIASVSLIGFYAQSCFKDHGVYDQVIAKVNPSVKHLKFYRCHLGAVHIEGDGLTDLTFLRTSSRFMPKYFSCGNIYLPESVITITCEEGYTNCFGKRYNSRNKYPPLFQRLRLCCIKPHKQDVCVSNQRENSNIGERQISFVDEPIFDEEIYLS